MSTLKVCFCGNPIMGSWKIRALQISRQRSSWSCRGRLGPADIWRHDVFCFVKRADRRTMDFLRRLGKVVVYDILDCWMQPEDSAARTTPEQVHAYFRDYLRDLPADGVIFANRTMFEDLGRLVNNPTYIYHHFRPTLTPIAVKERPRLVGYEGEADYLGPWRDALERACRALGLSFAINPPRYTELDVGVSVRGGVHAAPMNCRYKSNVKAANFYGAALPCLAHADEAACRETDNGHFRFFRTEGELGEALADLLPYATRLRAHESCLRDRDQFAIENIARAYEAYFEEVVGAARAPAVRAAA